MLRRIVPIISAPFRVPRQRVAEGFGRSTIDLTHDAKYGGAALVEAAHYGQLARTLLATLMWQAPLKKGAADYTAAQDRRRGCCVINGRQAYSAWRFAK
jgi:hypothetical protein